LLYALFGLALTAVCATGTFIWLGKRRRRGFDEPRLRAAWHAVVWGSPALLSLTLAVRMAFGHSAPFAAIFWLGLAGAVIASVAAAGRSPQPTGGVAQQA
jgi:hypothetical protein